MTIDSSFFFNYFKIKKENAEVLIILPFNHKITKFIDFSSNKELKELYYKNIGVNCCTGIYEPFGYTLCEVLDRRIPVIVQNIDGPIEIVDKVKDYVYIYKVDRDSLEGDVQNFSETLAKFYTIDPETRLANSNLARNALDRFRPEIIKLDWIEVLDNLKSGSSEKGYFDYIYTGFKNLFN